MLLRKVREMGKKKASARKVASKKTVKKKKTPKRAVAKKKKKTTDRKKAVSKKVVKKKTSKKVAKKKPAASLGRPRVTGEAKLEQFFHKDYEARQVFDFLGVTTVKELEQHSPQEIVEKLTAPVVRTVNRIRTALAMSNRCLADDKDYALDFKKRYAAGK